MQAFSEMVGIGTVKGTNPFSSPALATSIWSDVIATLDEYNEPGGFTTLSGKGDEETHPLLSPDDEFANFERWDVGHISGSAPKTPDMLKYEYARSAPKTGLKLGREIVLNPYKMGAFGLLHGSGAHGGGLLHRRDCHLLTCRAGRQLRSVIRPRLSRAILAA